MLRLYKHVCVHVYFVCFDRAELCVQWELLKQGIIFSMYSKRAGLSISNWNSHFLFHNHFHLGNSNSFSVLLYAEAPSVRLYTCTVTVLYGKIPFIHKDVEADVELGYSSRTSHSDVLLILNDIVA